MLRALDCSWRTGSRQQLRRHQVPLHANPKAFDRMTRRQLSKRTTALSAGVLVSLQDTSTFDASTFAPNICMEAGNWEPHPGNGKCSKPVRIRKQPHLLKPCFGGRICPSTHLEASSQPMGGTPFSKGYSHVMPAPARSQGCLNQQIRLAKRDEAHSTRGTSYWSDANGS